MNQSLCVYLLVDRKTKINLRPPEEEKDVYNIYLPICVSIKADGTGVHVGKLSKKTKTADGRKRVDRAQYLF